jgi:hypothetical protein
LKLYRAAKVLTIPASVTLLSHLAIQPPKWTSPPPMTAVVQAQQPEALPEIPRIVATNKRIAQRVDDLRPCVKQRLQRVAEKLPDNVTLLVTSAHRTREEQAALKPTFGIKAAPGTSTHEDGRAIDLNVLVDGERISPRRNQAVIGEVMASEGFRYLGPKDPVHYSIPREELDDAAQDPTLEIMTWDELNELQERVAQWSGRAVSVGASAFTMP